LAVGELLEVLRRGVTEPEGTQNAGRARRKASEPMPSNGRHFPTLRRPPVRKPGSGKSSLDGSVMGSARETRLRPMEPASEWYRV